jgi:hypothetical protein
MVATSSQHTRHKLVTSLATCTLCQRRREGGVTWKTCSQHGKRCSQHGKSVRNTMFGCWLQHARHKLATCSPQTRNIARNMYTMSGEEGGAQHEKSVRNMGKGIHNIRNTLCNIMIRRPTCFMIRIVWLGRCPMLAPGSDVRALAVPYFLLHY